MNFDQLWVQNSSANESVSVSFSSYSFVMSVLRQTCFKMWLFWKIFWRISILYWVRLHILYLSLRVYTTSASPTANKMNVLMFSTWIQVLHLVPFLAFTYHQEVYKRGKGRRNNQVKQILHAKGNKIRHTKERVRTCYYIDVKYTSPHLTLLIGS